MKNYIVSVRKEIIVYFIKDDISYSGIITGR